MNKQELIEKIKNSPISAEHKQQILDLLEQNDLSFDLKEQIKTIIQEDIDADTSVPFTEEDLKEIEAITEDTSQKLTAVEETLGQDMQFVEKELNNLETTVNDLNKVIDQAQLETLRADIKG